MWRTIALGLVCLGLTGCSGPSGGGGDAPAPPKDPLDVYEAVFRYRLKNHPRDVRGYLSVDGRDLPADLLRRLRRDWPNLAPASEEPKEKGLRLSVSELKWIDANTAEVHAGYWFPTKFAGEGYFADHRVVKKDGQWVVASVSNEVMS